MNQTTLRRPASVIVCIGLLALAAHVLQILLFSHSLPFADQWDSEAAILFKPWMEGSLGLPQLLLPHNEHRMVWKHLFDLLFFELNGRYWDNRVIALANSLFYAAAMMVLGWNALAASEQRSRYLLVGLCLLLPFTTFAYENTLWGFQSPFMMLVLFGLLCLQWASRERFSLGNAIAVLAMVLASLVTMASGFLLAPIAAALILSQRGEPGVQRWQQYLSAALALGIGIAGYLMTPQLAHHAVLRVQSPAEFISAAAVVLSWPAPRLPLLWLPFFFWALFSLVYRQTPTRPDRFFAAVACWIGLQGAAIAFSRGHDMLTVPSRYTDILIFGLVANTYFLGRLLWHPRRELQPRLPLRLALLACTLVVAGFGVQEQMRTLMVSRYKLVLWQANHELTAAMLAGAAVSADNFALVYPDKTKLQGFLADPTIRRMLGATDGQLPADCAAPGNAWLSRAACALAGGGSQLPAFSKEAAPPAAQEPLLCSLDMLAGVSVDGSATASPSLPLRFAGWLGPGVAGLRGMHQPLLLRLASAQDTVVAGSAWRHPRPDVAAVENNPRMTWSGFDMTVSSRGLAPGSYSINLVQEGRVCDTRQKLVVN